MYMGVTANAEEALQLEDILRDPLKCYRCDPPTPAFTNKKLKDKHQATHHQSYAVITYRNNMSKIIFALESHHLVFNRDLGNKGG